MSSVGKTVEVFTPEPFLFLTEERHRYKVARGGRASLKSWQFARALLILGLKSPRRILCAREVQKSIKDSVHALLADQIKLMGLGRNYDVLETEIRGRNGTVILFTGLAVHTVESIKSFEGVDICWVEEAQTVRRKSWNILIPTIRKPGSEIWATFNPELDTDDTYDRFVVNPPPDASVLEVNWRDNPWFADSPLAQERAHAERTMSREEYANIWEGKCRTAVSGAIYAEEIRAATEGRRITNVPYDPTLKVHAVFDLGWNDSMFITLVQRGAYDLRVVGCIEDSHRTLDSYSAQLLGMRWNWGKLVLPHDGNTGDFKTGTTARKIMEGLGWSVIVLPNTDVEAGIRTVRTIFPKVYFDKVNAGPLINCLKRYKRAVNAKTAEGGDPVHDAACLGPDTKIRTLSGWKRIADLEGKEFYVWGYSERERRLVPAKAARCWKAKTVTTVTRVTFDNGAVITCTPDHRFMLRDGSWLPAQSLKIADSLMPFYERDITVISVETINQITDVYDIEVPELGNFVAEGVVVHNSHGADSFRYMCVAAPKLTNDQPSVPRAAVFRAADPGMGY